MLHNALTSLGIFSQVPVDVRREGAGFVVRSEGRIIAVPAAIRWRMYRRGWAKRLLRLAAQFGVPDLAAIGPGDIVIDIGANVGEFALACAARGARVQSIEGDPTVFACLSRNIADQPLITAHQMVVWHSEEELTFFSADVYKRQEEEYSRHNFDGASTEMLFQHFKDAEAECQRLLDFDPADPKSGKRIIMVHPAYDQTIKASHLFNLLDARGVISVTDRQAYIGRVRALAKKCADAYRLTDAGADANA